MTKNSGVNCQHSSLYCDALPHPLDGGFKRPTSQKRLAAATRSGRVTAKVQTAVAQDAFNDDETFPGPLVLPDDALAIDPEDPPQSLKSWLMTVDGQGHRVSHRRKTLYIIPPPTMSDEVKELMKDWALPKIPKGHKLPGIPQGISEPEVTTLKDYLAAFYHLMPVKILDPGFTWVPWSTTTSSSSNKAPKAGVIQRIGLQTPRPNPEIVGVAHRPSPDGVARQQLNLNDIIDAMIPRVPPDAHAVVMLTREDLYEDEEDDFCCGRAYGGSRVAVVSSFRYRPALDGYADVDVDHGWPASHCKAYVDELCSSSPAVPPTKRRKGAAAADGSGNTPPTIHRDTSSSPLAAAVEAALPLMTPHTAQDHAGLWMSRVARTVSHEVGHCLTLGHCVYFACAMQGTASVAEDNRQPPYLCPVCVEKLSRNLAPLLARAGASDGRSVVDLQRTWMAGQYRTLLAFCDGWPQVALFAGLGAWLRMRLAEVAPRGGNETDTDGEETTVTAAAQSAEVRKKTAEASSAQFAAWLRDQD